MANYQEFMDRADETALSLTRSSQNWTAFLQTAARLYKYPYNEQLMIYSQRPDAIACAEFDVWNKCMGRYIKRGSKGIMVSDGKKARYVFDVSDTGTREKSRPFKLWKYSDEYDIAVQKMFTEKYGSDSNVFFNMVNDAVRKSAQEYWRANRRNIIDIVANSFLEGYDGYNIKVKFIDAVSVSATYAVLSRCGFDPGEYFEHEDFLSIFDFNTVDTISELGTATSEINQQILRSIEITIKNYERAKLAERTENYDRTDLHEERRLLSSEPDLSPNGNDLRQVRNDERGLSETAQAGTLEQADTPRGTDTAPERNRQGGTGADRTDDAGADENGRSDGGIEENRPIEMGGLDERLPGTGGGNRTYGAGVQLSLFPTEEEQIKIIDEAEDELPFAFSISETDLENLLRTGSNTSNARMRIIAEFSKNKGLESNIDFLKEIYHGGYGIKGEIDDFSAWYAEDGIHINRGTTARYSQNAQVYSWAEAANKITQMLDNCTFATNVELTEAPGFERKQRRKQFDGLYGEYNSVKEAHPSDMVLFQVGDFFEMFGEDAKAAADILDIHLTNRTINNVGTAPMCGIPAFSLEANVEKLRDKYDVTISATDAKTEQRGVYTLLSVNREAEQAKTDVEKSLEQYKPVVIAAVTEDMPYRNACGHSDRENAVIEGNAAVRRAVLNSDDIELIRLFSDMPDFRNRLHSEVFDETYPQLHELLRPLSQDDIENTVRTWNGNAESKRRVNEYMAQHGRERGASAWLANEYGGDDMLVARHGSPEESKLPWTTVQRTLIRMIADDTFLTAADRMTETASIDDMTDEEKQEHIDVVETAKDYGLPLPREDIEVYDKIIEERERGREAVENVRTEAELDALPISVQIGGEWRTFDNAEEAEKAMETEVVEQTDYSQYIGREIEVDDRRFVVEHINDLFHTVELRDITFQNGTGFPIFRSESLEWLKRVMELQEHSNEPVAPETVAVYPAEENNIPYDIVIERIPSDAPTPAVGNFHITDDHLGEGGAKAKFRANMDAINLLKELEFEGRQATEEEQEILSKYVGWGSLPDAFDESKENWADEFTELYTALSPDEYKAAKASVLNAHYTSPTVIRAMYEAIEKMGFTKGNILEPSMGIGNFFGMLPESMSQSNLYGVELDSITGKIAKQLYPKADITVAGFETTDRRDFYDLSIGNVPFGNYQVSDKAYNKLGFPIHDYFIAKAIDQVRPGGVIVFVTSRYTLDKQSPEARQYFAKRAELLGAIRLPNTAFKANAGTSVVSDIIFLQKRESPIEIEPDWVHLGKNADGFAINSYFIDNPNMVLGRQTSESTQYGKEDFTVVPYEGVSLEEQLKEAITYIRGSYTEAEIDDMDDRTGDTIPADPSVKNYSYTIVDDEVYFRRNSVMVKPDMNATAIQRIKGMIGLRGCVNELIEKQIREGRRRTILLHIRFVNPLSPVKSRRRKQMQLDMSSRNSLQKEITLL